MGNSKRILEFYVCAHIYAVALAYNGHDSNVRHRLVEEFHQLCPYTDLCYSKANKTFTPSFGSNTGIKEACCQSCSCENGCGMKCCPDLRNESLSNEEFDEIKNTIYACIYPQFRPHDENKVNAGRAFEFISRCPTGYIINEVKKLCEQDYWDFDLSENFAMMVPVSSALDNITYKNSFCRQCNSGSDIYLRYWHPVIVCTLGSLAVGSVGEIRGKLVEDRFCNLVFNKPDGLNFKIKPCSKLIDQCNVTGDWARYDRFVEEACLSYVSRYAYNYKNVHCYLCNGFDMSAVENVCELEGGQSSPHSFIALLDFNNLEDASKIKTVDSNIEKDCDAGTQLDPMTGMCLSLRCPKGMFLTGSQCLPVYNTLKTFRGRPDKVPMEIVMSHVATGSNRKMGYAFDTIDNLARIYDVSLYSIKNMFNFIDEICEISMFVQLDQPYPMMLNNWRELYISGQWIKYISFIATRILLMTRDEDAMVSTNVSELVEDVAAFFSGNQWGSYMIRYHNIDSTLFGKHSYKTFPANESVLDSTIIPLHRISLYDNCPDSYIAVEPDPFCGKVCIPQIQVVGYISNQVQINISGTLVAFGKFVLDNNTDCVYVCWDTYIKQADKVINRSMEKKNHNAVQSEQTPNDVNNDVMVSLTIVFLVCSLLCLLFTIAVYCILPNLRTVPGLNNMALSVSIFLYQALMLVNSIEEIQLPYVCTAIGMCLHYFLVGSYFWMFICTFHMAKVFLQISNKSVLHSNRGQFLHYIAFSVVGSLILVVAVVTISVVESKDDNLSIGYGGSPCYVKDHRMILYFVAIPLAVMLLANFTMFITVVIRVCRLPDMAASSTHERKNLVIFAKLSTITGLTWSFGLLFQFTGLQIFAYMYVILNGGQGVFLFTAFLANSRVLTMLKGGKSARYTSTGSINTRSIKTNMSTGVGETAGVKQ